MAAFALVVTDEEEEAAAFVERTLIGHRVHEHERIGPADIRLEFRLIALLLPFDVSNHSHISTLSFRI